MGCPSEHDWGTERGKKSVRKWEQLGSKWRAGEGARAKGVWACPRAQKKVKVGGAGSQVWAHIQVHAWSGKARLVEIKWRDRDKKGSDFLCHLLPDLSPGCMEGHPGLFHSRT